MLYEGLKQNSTIVIVPSTAVESMQLGGLAGLTALTMGLGQEQALRERAAANKITYDPVPVLAANADPVTPSQNGHLDVAASR